MKLTPSQIEQQQKDMLQSAIDKAQKDKANQIVSDESSRLDNEATRSGNLKKLIIGVLVAIVLMACAYQNQSAKDEAKPKSKTISIN